LKKNMNKNSANHWVSLITETLAKEENFFEEE